MAKGDGSIIEKARGVWEVQVPLGRDPITGKYRKKSRTVRPTPGRPATRSGASWKTVSRWRPIR